MTLSLKVNCVAWTPGDRPGVGQCAKGLQEGRPELPWCANLCPPGRREPLRHTDPRTVLLEGATYLQTHFGRLDLPLGEFIRLRQGDVDLPMDGGPDSLRAATSYDEAPDGRLLIRHGDSFIRVVTWDRSGRVNSESIQPFGAASTRPKSKHYTDQARMFVAHRFKPVRFAPASLRGHVERRYRP